MKYRSILMFGEPGCGKGTQGRALGSLPGFFHLSTGEMFRALDPQSESGQLFRSFADYGKLVPNEVTVRLWREHVKDLVRKESYRPDRDVLILDGIPRNVPQARMLAEDIEVVCVLHLVVRDREAMVRRLKGRAQAEGRRDDADEKVIRRRSQVYGAESAPVIEFYPREKRADIDALGTPAAVLAEVAAAAARLEPGGGA